MNHSALALSVVGHTNTGKTSLMRTLLRDIYFGEVQNATATTRHVEEALICDAQQHPLIQLYDTPGLEDASGILDWLDDETSPKYDKHLRLMEFINHAESQKYFSQEIKVLKQLIKSDIAIYVIDAREPVLAKYKDELEILSWCAKPIMPIFNFTHGQEPTEWTETLAKIGLHTHTAFDTVAFDFTGEMQLWEKLATMLPQNLRPIVQTLMQHRQQEWQNLQLQAKTLTANFLINIAAYCREIPANQDNSPVLADMQNTVRQNEHKIQQQISDLYKFYKSEFSANDWALTAFQQDPFDAELLKKYSIRTGKGAAIGAVIGLSLDIASAGLSLGTGTSIGAAIGGTLFNFKSISNKIKGIQTLHIDNATLAVLGARQQELLQTLQTRGHASNQHIALSTPDNIWKRLPDPLNKARSYPEWSALNPAHISNDEERNEALQQLIQHI